MELGCDDVMISLRLLSSLTKNYKRQHLSPDDKTEEFDLYVISLSSPVPSCYYYGHIYPSNKFRTY
jgi:hypothetical protein